MTKKQHNYRNYSKAESEVSAFETIVPETETVEETPTIPSPKNLECTLNNCKKLNVRKEPNKNAKVLCIVDAETKMTVSMDESTNNWYKVRVKLGRREIVGYCMREFIIIT